MAFFEFPHTRTYDSDLAWLIRAYKILTGKVNNIEQTIEDTINEALQGEALKQLITQMIAEALPLNVKYPPAESGLTPAVGDGETDDTAALQDMIAYANANNMPMIFPAGVYRVTGLDVNVDTVFQGFDATLMLAPVSAKPLITLTADLASSGLTLNGNLGGQTTAQNVINIENGSFAITNTTIMGGKSCIEGTLVGDSIIGDSYLRNFQEYGIHAEGSGSFTASNVVVPSVASSGAMRFMLIDCDNCTISNFSSQAAITTGFEITGDNNAISANIPNAETTVNDSGTGNTWTITGKDEKRYFEGSGTLSYQNLQETVEGDYTQTVGDFDGTATGHYSFSGEDVIINPTNPLTYKTPVTFNDYFNSIKFKSPDGTPYNVLVSTENTYKLKEYTEPFNSIFNVVEYGAKNDGTEDCSEIINSIISENTGGLILFPEGEYLLSEPITINKPFNVIGTYAYMDFQSGLHGSVIKFSGSEAFKIEYCGVQISTLCITSTTPLSGNAITFNDNTTSQSGSTINCTIKDVYIYNVNVGILQQVSSVFKTLIEKVWVNTCNIGIFFTRGTSITLLNCWVTWAHNTGYNLTELTYSALINCACDNCYTIGYNIVNCNNIDILSCGCETTPVVAEDPPTAPAFFVQGSNLVHINVSFINCRGLTGDQTAILVLTGTEQCIIDRCWIAGERTTTWFVFDNNGKNNVMFNTLNSVSSHTFQARLNGSDVSLSQIISTTDAS